MRAAALRGVPSPFSASLPPLGSFPRGDKCEAERAAVNGAEWR